MENDALHPYYIYTFSQTQESKHPNPYRGASDEWRDILGIDLGTTHSTIVIWELDKLTG